MRPSMAIIGTADFQRRARTIFGRIRRSRRAHLVLARNTPQAVVLNVATYERMERDLVRLREEARIAEKVRIAEDDVRRGRVRTGDLRTLLHR